EDAKPAAGNPHLEKRLIDACLEAINSENLVGMQDMGAAGLTSSGSEMASAAGTGMLLDLDAVPQVSSDMSAHEMMLSETQERMLLVVQKGTEKEFIDLFKSFETESAVECEVFEEKGCGIEHAEKIWADIPVDALDSDAPIYYFLSTEAAYDKDCQNMNLPIPEVTSHSA